MPKEKISLIVPCYNEEEVLPYFYEEFKKTAGQLAEYELELLFVDDGSKDSTLDLAIWKKWEMHLRMEQF